LYDDDHDFVGMRWRTHRDADGNAEYTTISQEDYIRSKVFEAPVDPGRKRHLTLPLNDSEMMDYWSLLGKLLWVVRRTRWDLAFNVSYSAQRAKCATIQDLLFLNKTARYIRHTMNIALKIPRLLGTLRVVGICDAAEGRQGDKHGQGGNLIGLKGEDSADAFAPIASKSHKLRRVGSSSFDVETLAAMECTETALVMAMWLEESRYGPRPGLRERKILEMYGCGFVADTQTAVIHHSNAELQELALIELQTDANNLVQKTSNIKDDLDISARRKNDKADLKELQEAGQLAPLCKIDGLHNPADILTKLKQIHDSCYRRFLRAICEGSYREM
jgi:hypothetical protein